MEIVVFFGMHLATEIYFIVFFTDLNIEIDDLHNGKYLTQLIMLF